ncbi:hypothetical protein AB0M43_36250 [Longispora sp. NPDC051575]|uniref:hypothetical protein n=1 Tax=Longispora sp. NPDC051575 TaxID=3154943 RepID=UPI0034131DFF
MLCTDPLDAFVRLARRPRRLAVPAAWATSRRQPHTGPQALGVTTATHALSDHLTALDFAFWAEALDQPDCLPVRVERHKVAVLDYRACRACALGAAVALAHHPDAGPRDIVVFGAHHSAALLLACLGHPLSFPAPAWPADWEPRQTALDVIATVRRAVDGLRAVLPAAAPAAFLQAA